MRTPEELEPGDMEVLEHGSEPYPTWDFIYDMVYMFAMTLIVLNVQVGFIMVSLGLP